MKVVSCIVLGLLFVSSPLRAQKQVLAEIENVRPKQIKSAGFSTDRQQKVEIETFGFYLKIQGKYDFTLTNAWILDADSRELMWEMKDAAVKPEPNKLQSFKDAVILPAGNYEVHYSFFPYYTYKDGYAFDGFINHIFYKLFGWKYEDGEWAFFDEYDDKFKDFRITVSGSGNSTKLKDQIGAHKNRSFISMSGLRGNVYETTGFELKKPMELEIYAVGEANEEGNYDYAWIINTQTLEKVWKFSFENSGHAGGAMKNRRFHKKVKFDEGRYALFCVTDDSHHEGEWNSAPPYDPAFWGVNLKTVGKNAASVETFDYEYIPEKDVVVKLTRMRDSDFRSFAFSLAKPATFRVYAIGEGKDGRMYDYAWIVDGKKHKKVWEMDFKKTEHAGGSPKNRLFDGLVSLDRGSYVVNYATDGTHSYKDWNESAPYDPEHWGITLIAADDKFDFDWISEYKPEEDQSVLAGITRVRDSEYKRKSFELEKNSVVRVYALGEGKHGTMYDYGWIEDSKGQVVWEMTYKMTNHAGGDDKNRLFDDQVMLKKGKYDVYYATDGSHNFGDWNSDPPFDQSNWGITVFVTQDIN